MRSLGHDEGTILPSLWINGTNVGIFSVIQAFLAKKIEAKSVVWAYLYLFSS
jgi:hypothetical protein